MAAALEMCWVVWFRPPLATNNALCRRLGWPELVLQPEPLCRNESTGRPHRRPRFVCTDSTSLVETLLFMATLHRRDARAERMVNALLAEWPTTKSFAVPWGLAHMHYIENQLLAEGFVEREDGYKEHLVAWP
ncbi:Hypothetical protein (Fragment) [Durusdinium trenchii]|uniref:Uncharacterized protein n=1 Tax=Durusdinium trenchii TaxID=1381693 RepID=A0ABP0Q4P5_9DINO